MHSFHFFVVQLNEAAASVRETSYRLDKGYSFLQNYFGMLIKEFSEKLWKALLVEEYYHLVNIMSLTTFELESNLRKCQTMPYAVSWEDHFPENEGFGYHESNIERWNYRVRRIHYTARLDCAMHNFFMLIVHCERNNLTAVKRNN
ncbi:hypothetical protein M513_05632 [Trichuris suis]|uniref:Uncharacterized protein n=1 Tax=Trichuris suis TaxID=68888 RepID=A0A085M8I0_9BILA|nr:hypothetical protein M513_05632 [Trichuris suis]